MSKIICLADRKRRNARNDSIVKKLIDGELVDYVDFEMLSASQQMVLLNQHSSQDRQ